MICSAHKTNGQPCKAKAIKGGTVCRVHGGSAPQVRAKAKQRLLEALDPAAAELVRIAVKGKNERDRIAAIRELFARAGFGEADRLDVDLMTAESRVDMEIQRLLEQMDDLDPATPPG